jgi:hypothetical protein
MSLLKCLSVTPNGVRFLQARKTFHSPDAAEPPKISIRAATTPTAIFPRCCSRSPYRSKPGLGDGARATLGRVRNAMTMLATTAAAISRPTTTNSSTRVPSTVLKTEPRSTERYQSRWVQTSVKTLNAMSSTISVAIVGSRARGRPPDIRRVRRGSSGMS